ncbi:MAG: sigma-70 family RNA polymerase sigma factor [Phycisphaerales bacterium]|nr:MAG: sigma-70 family RNA polymerase sigma factor [Phycisphaerales bacterium]
MFCVLRRVPRHKCRPHPPGTQPEERRPDLAPPSVPGRSEFSWRSRILPDPQLGYTRSHSGFGVFGSPSAVARVLTVSTLLQRIAGGDHSAVTACVQEYGGLIWRLANRYLDRAKGEIEDAVQEVFVELWTKADRYDPSKGSEPAFVATIAHRRLIDYQRRVSARPDRTSTSERPPEGVAPASIEVKRADLAHAALAFNKLPEDERQALWMSVRSGMTHQQIAHATNAPIGTVKSRLRRGLIRLTEAVAKEPAVQSDRQRTGGGA